MAASAFLLTGIFGPSDDGLRCTRAGGTAQCEIFQTRFFGWFGNRSLVIPESSILDAEAVCSKTRVGGRGGPSCNVSLGLRSGEKYLVLSYELKSQADTSAARLNTYLSNTAKPSIELREDLVTPWLLSGGVPVVFIGLILSLSWWRKRRSP